jgi:hypothetical protein
MRREFMWTSMALAGALAGCGNTINVVYSGEEQKVILYPKKGDVIKWTKPGGTPVAVKIFPPTPPFCKEDPASGQCTVALDKGRALYECQGVPCTDPEIEVGSSIGVLGGRVVAPARTPPTSIAYLYCDGDNAVIRPATATFKQNSGASLLWRSLGNGPPDWTVDNLQNPICQEIPPFNTGNATCSLKADATAPATTYRATVQGCANPATGTIYINP